MFLLWRSTASWGAMLKRTRSRGKADTAMQKLVQAVEAYGNIFTSYSPRWKNWACLRHENPTCWQTVYTLRPFFFFLKFASFTFRLALNLHSTDWTMCWNHSSKILVHIDTKHHTAAANFSVACSGSTACQGVSLRSGDYGGHLCELIDTFKKPVWEDYCFVMLACWTVKGLWVSSNTQVDCNLIFCYDNR